MYMVWYTCTGQQLVIHRQMLWYTCTGLTVHVYIDRCNGIHVLDQQLVIHRQM